MLLALPACGGGGGGSSSDGTSRSEVPGDTAAPTAMIVFPPPQSRTEAAEITVRGIAFDEGTITGIRVNGVEASSSDGFAHWQAVVALSGGVNTLVVETADDAVRSNFDTDAARVTVVNEPQMVEPADVAVDATGGRIIVVDAFTERVLATDLDGSARRVLSDDDDAVGTPTSRLGLAAPDPAGNRLFLHDRGASPALLVAMDLDTGGRTLVATLSGLTGSGARALAHDASQGAGSERVLLLDVIERAVFAIDIATGVRTVLSDAATGTGEALREPLGLVVDGANGRALVTDYDGATRQSALVAVDLATGNRTFVSPFAMPGTRLGALALDPASATVYAIEGRRIHSIDVSSEPSAGARAVVSDADGGIGAGEAFGLAAGIAFDAAAGRLLVSDSALDAVVAVAPGSGDRTPIATNDAGRGERMTGLLEGVQVDPDRNVAYVLSQATNLWRVDLDTGERRLLLDDPRLAGMRDIVLDAANNRLLGVAEVASVSTTRFRVLGIDLDTGAIATLAGDGTGTGADFGVSVPPLAVELDEVGGRLLTTRRLSLDDVLGVDLASGDRDLVSASAPTKRGEGPSMIDLAGIALDTARGELFALGRGAGAPSLFGIDPGTGDRRVVSSHASPGEAWDDTTGHIALDAARDRVLLVRDLNEVIALPGVGAIDIATGARAMLSDGDRGRGSRFLAPDSIAVDPVRDVAVASDSGLGALVLIDLASGDRAIVSR